MHILYQANAYQRIYYNELQEREQGRIGQFTSYTTYCMRIIHIAIHSSELMGHNIYYMGNSHYSSKMGIDIVNGFYNTLYYI